MDASRTRRIVYVGDDSDDGPPREVSEDEVSSLGEGWRTLLEERDLRPRRMPNSKAGVTVTREQESRC